MKKKKNFQAIMMAILIAAFVCSASFIGCSSSDDGGGDGNASTATLTGTVTDSSTGAAISDAAVKLDSYETTTDAEGTYTISGITTGTHTLTITKTGYQLYQASTTIVDGSNTQNVSLTVETTQTGSLTGTVKYGETLLEEALVELQNVGSYTTATDGKYSFSQVVYGTYTMTVTKSGYENYSSSVTINSSTNTHDISMSVSSDIPAPDAGKGHIVGYVTDGSENPLNNVQCTLYALSSGKSVRTTSVYSSSNGRYIFLNVNPGSYQVTFSLSGYIIPYITTTVNSDTVTEPPVNPGEPVTPDPINPNPAQEKTWQVNYGGSNSDIAYSEDLSSDEGTIIAGSTTSSVSGDVTGTNNGSNDFWVVKLDSEGALDWQKNYGGADSDTAKSIKATSDGGYIVAGYTSSSSSGDVSGANKGNYDLWVVKLTGTGVIEWEKNYGGSEDDKAYSIRQTSDGGYIVAGETGSNASGDVSGACKGLNDFWVVKLSSTGVIEWEKNYGGSGYDEAYSVLQSSDGGYIVAGRTSSSSDGDVTGANNGIYDYWIVKLNSTGAIEWQKNYGGSNTDYCYAIQQTSDGGYITAGHSNSSATGDFTGTGHGNYDIWVVKLTDAGVLEWQKNYGGNGVEHAYDLKITSDGGYVVAGDTTSSANGDVTGTNKGISDTWTVKLNNTGTIQWQYNYGGSSNDTFYGICETSEGKFIQCGPTQSSQSEDVTGTSNGNNDFWIVELTSLGVLSQ